MALGEMTGIFCDLNQISPVSLPSSPYMMRESFAIPDPSRPKKPSTSPFFMEKLTLFRAFFLERSFTSKSTSLSALEVYFLVAYRLPLRSWPTMLLIRTSSVRAESFVDVATWRPSRSTVTRSVMSRISFRRWEM